VIDSLRGGSLMAGLAAGTGWVVVDAGRWDPSQPTAARLGGADVIAVVCRSTAVSIAHARDLILPLRTLAPTASVVVVQVGGEPYPPSETAQVVDAPVFGPVAWDPKGVTALWSTGATPGGDHAAPCSRAGYWMGWPLLMPGPPGPAMWSAEPIIGESV
jgi:hypothetical protein